jgi:hypothetical protein
VTNVAGGALTVMGVLIAVLGLFAAGSISTVAIGLSAVFAGGVLEALTRRSSGQKGN